MKKIVPFNNVLEFNTDVKEITAISLEHEINKYPDMISGVFYISGEYKITEGLLDKEKFNFELPFDIALSNNYRTDSLLVDIDDFRYDLISDKNLKVNIDLYIDGEIEEPTPVTISNFEESDEITFSPEKEILIQEDRRVDSEKEESFTEEIYEDKIDFNGEEQEEPETKEVIEPERIDLLKEMLTDTKEEKMEENTNKTNETENENINENININIFDNTKEENYVTYRVYKVEENDTIDTILTKYNITKEQLADYNNIENIIPGVKLIIPTYEK